MKIYKAVFTLRTPGGRSTTITGLYSPDESKTMTQQEMREEVTRYKTKLPHTPNYPNHGLSSRSL